MKAPEYFIGTNKYGKYAIPLEVKNNPRFDVKQILKGSIHEPDTIEYMLKHGKNGLVVHAGAFYGDFLPALAMLPKVWAFEPYTRYWECCKKTLDLNFPEGQTNLGLWNLGLGESTYDKPILHSDADGKPLGGEAFLSYDDEDKLAIFEKRNKFDWNINENVSEVAHIVTLDKMVFELDVESLSIIQYDLEGFEEKALMGSIQSIDKFKPTLILEAWRASDDKASIPKVFQTDFIKEEILGRGYRVVGALHHNIILKAK